MSTKFFTNHNGNSLRPPRKILERLKSKHKKEVSELSANIGQLKMSAEDGKLKAVTLT